MGFTVDRERCVGSAYCQRFAPDVFDVDDSGLAFVLDGAPVGPSLVAARLAARECPSLSITETPSSGDG
jgi:ferredoxin